VRSYKTSLSDFSREKILIKMNLNWRKFNGS
jgi:hypothetical protein